MTQHRSDDAIDQLLLAYLQDRAESGAARAQTPEELAAQLAPRLRPRFWLNPATGSVRRIASVLAVAALLLALLAGLLVGGQLLREPPTRLVTIAMELPLGGSDPGGESIANGVRLAVHDAGGRVGHFRVEVPQAMTLSDLVDGVSAAAPGAANMRTIVLDPTVVAVIGPSSSSVALEQIPISNAAGLLQCSPASTNPQLTQTADSGSLASRGPAQTRPSFIRTVTTDDVAAAVAARYIFERLGKTSVYVVGETQGDGSAMADWFGAEFTRLGGTVVARATLPTSAAALSAMLVAVRPRNPQAIYFGGSGERGATLLNAAIEAGMGTIPFVGPDPLSDGSATTAGSFLQLVGPGAAHAYSVVPGAGDGPGIAAFRSRFRAAYVAEPTQFAALGYACAQVVMAALREVDKGPTADVAGIREPVRAAGVDTASSFDTILGAIAFDAGGDVAPRRVSILSYDATANNWVQSDQMDAATAIGN